MEAGSPLSGSPKPCLPSPGSRPESGGPRKPIERRNSAFRKRSASIQKLQSTEKQATLTSRLYTTTAQRKQPYFALDMHKRPSLQIQVTSPHSPGSPLPLPMIQSNKDKSIEKMHINAPSFQRRKSTDARKPAALRAMTVGKGGISGELVPYKKGGMARTCSEMEAAKFSEQKEALLGLPVSPSTDALQKQEGIPKKPVLPQISPVATPQKAGPTIQLTEDKKHMQKRVKIDQEEFFIPFGLELNKVEIDFEVLSTAATVSERFRSAAKLAKDPFTFIVALENRHDVASELSSNIPAELEFAYLNPVKKESPTFNPYHLEIVDHDKIDKNDFYTISRKGVTHFLNGVADFTPLSQWIREYHLFNNIITIPFFAKYRLWKCYTVWHKNVRAAKIHHNRKMLTKHLFLVDSVLSQAILEIRRICLTLYSWRLGNIDTHITYTLSEYDQQQKVWVTDTIKPTLEEFENTMRKTVETACQMSLKKAGFDIQDDSVTGVADEDKEPMMGLDPLDMATSANEDLLNTQVNGKKKMSFTQQAARRTECRRLQRFVKLADYMIIQTLHFLTISSIKDLLFFVHRNCTDQDVILAPEEKDHIFAAIPTMTLVEKGYTAFASRTVALTLNDPLIQNTPSERPEIPGEDQLAPLFRAELLLNLESDILFFAPDLSEFLTTMEVLLKTYVAVIESVHLLTGSIPYLEQNDRFEEQERGEGPNIAAIIQESYYFQSLIIRLRGTLSGNFHNARTFAETFKAFQDMYVENGHIDFSLLSLPKEVADTQPKVDGIFYPDPTLEFFESAMSKYSQQKQRMLQIAVTTRINNLLMDTSKLKELLLPSPQRCFNEIAKVLPGLARDKNETILTDLNHSLRIFTSPVQNVEAFVEYLEHLQQVRAAMESTENHYNEVTRLYLLMEQYNVQVVPTDIALYQTLGPTLRQFKEVVDMAEDTKEENISKFSLELEKNIAELVSDVLKLRDRAQDPMIYNPNAKVDTVLRYLDDLIKQVEKQSAMAENYSKYQNNFKVMPYKYVELEETKSEIQLKRSLWISFQKWEASVEKWKFMPFDTLNTEELNSEIQSYLKTIYILEKGLPANDVLPKLKSMVDEYRVMYPTIVDLRNYALKQRHWDKIQDAIGRSLVRDESFTLAKLMDSKIFDFKEEVATISSQASSEAALEELLNKVAKVWSEVEFAVLPYRDSKDVFILGGVDDIQTQLEDSQVTIASLKTSRYIGPIKSDVERWDRNLTLFAETLDAWVVCQRNWLYLESIFNAPDIQRQLPEEAKMFSQVDRAWKDIMRKTYRNPNALKAGTTPGVLETMNQNNTLLDKILKCLEDYLESKRLLFPRFYFLSNDELLEILSQIRNPQAVQPHLGKCFDAIKSLEFSSEPKSIDILSIISPEGERLPFGKVLKARGNVESWLSSVEETMFTVVRRNCKAALGDYDPAKRMEWVLSNSGQVVLTVNQIVWCREVAECLKQQVPQTALSSFKNKCIQNLNGLATLVRGNLSILERNIAGALITLDVHNRDIVQGLITARVSSVSDFEWGKQLRYYWDADLDTCVVRMSSSVFQYGYEYLGCSPRLVITPLTDRCYLTLTGAMALNLGGSPVGPAGTGKTETVKDLAKALARQCVVFNCSDSLDYKMMGKFFAGLAQSGAWCCFDEFNRIDIEVLSVIAQQLLTIKNAKDARLSKFMFEGREIRLIETCASFITMNPGYAGRTELPDNLKALFRPVAMMIPDYRLIAEIILYSEGFENARTLSGKVVNLYKLCSEQLSKQDHYDFGMRAVKSVLVMAGSLKRNNLHLSEDVVLIRSLRDSNLPKFLAEDVPLFKGILQDLFPGIVIPNQDYGELSAAVEQEFLDRNLNVVSSMVERTIQLFDTMKVRHGVMLVGPTGGGKTTSYRVLAAAMAKLHDGGSNNPDYQKVRIDVINPKCITMAELYGEFNLATMEWKDGLIGSMFRNYVSDTSEDKKWLVCDGPVDALWIENMNTVLDDNKLLCLANSERIKMNSTMEMLFEVADLAVASPATVSRCGMVYMDPNHLGWRPFVATWIRSLPKTINEELKEWINSMFEEFVDPALRFVRKFCSEFIPSVDLNLVMSLAKLLLTFLGPESKGMEATLPLADLKTLVTQLFCFCFVWSFGGNLSDGCQEKFDSFLRELMDTTSLEVAFPSDHSVFSYYVDVKARSFYLWDDLLPSFQYSPDIPFFQMIVPTVDTVRFHYLLDKLVARESPVLLTGTTGVGKSVIVQDFMSRYGKKLNYLPINLNFSAQTTSKQTQQTIELKLEKKRKNILGAPPNHRIVLFVDDLNMPKLDTYGSQPPLELLRQLLDFGGFYDRDRLTWKSLQDISVVAACAPPGGGRNVITPRLTRHFNLLNILAPSDLNLGKIFKSIVDGFLKSFSSEIMSTTDMIVNSSIEMYRRMCSELLPTPAKSHYTFNLRDMSKVVQGMLQCRPTNFITKNHIVRLFCHESSRIFHDRLIDAQDRNHFLKMLCEIVEKNFAVQMNREVLQKSPILYGDFLRRGVPPEDRIYTELEDMEKLNALLEDYLEEYNVTLSRDMRLIFFLDAKQHITRIARIIRQPRGNGLLVGVGGTGKQSLTRLACHIADYECIQIELTRVYGFAEWREDVKKLYLQAGVDGRNTVFLITDTQIKSETFLEDINNILNTGEITNLFEVEEREKMIGDLRQAAKDKGFAEDRDSVSQFFINRVRDNLHIVFATSPVGDTFRNRCRMFPSLVNCCTIDWFDEWPRDALLSVSKRFLEFVDLGSPELKPKIAEACVEVHTSVTEAAKKFYAELRRRYYTTPTSYLELINLYTAMLQEQRKVIGFARDRLRNGLSKLSETNEMVAKMQIELELLGPELRQKATDVETLMVKIAKDQETADGVRKFVSEEEAQVKEKALQTEAIASEAQKDLDEALPALQAAYKSLDALEKKDIAEMKAFSKPPELVMIVMEAVCILFKVKPDWENSKKLLSDPQFLKKMTEFDKENVTDSVTKKLKKYIDMPTFTPDSVEKVSKAAKSLCMWVIAINLYSRVYREVQPKRKRLEEAQQTLELTRTKLQEKTMALQEVESQLSKLKQQYEESIASKKQLSEKIEESTRRLQRASKLTLALADEQIRWTASVTLYDEQINALVGNIFLAAACVAYYGAFTSSYRQSLNRTWIQKCIGLEIPVSPLFSLVDTLGEQVVIRDWNIQGLPADDLSTENGILVTRGRRWPLMIDPQGQANRWIRNMEGANLKIIKPTDPKFMRSLENALRTGQPILMEDMGEQIDPALEPILLKQTTRQGGRLLMKLGDNYVEYDRSFKLYMTTKLQNPHYLPEVCIKVTIINFTVTKVGLEGQLLADVVKQERPELEEQRNNLIVSISNDKKQLQEIEEKILRLMYHSQGNILDDEELINTLNQSKLTSAAITERVKLAEETAKEINLARDRYRPVAVRGSLLYFVVADLSELDPMYQFSLKYFKNLFNNCVYLSDKSEQLDLHIANLCKDITFTIFENVSRGLFEKDKLIFSLMMCIELCLEKGKMTPIEWNFFLRGGQSLAGNLPPIPRVRWMNEVMWKQVCDLANTIPHFQYLIEHISMHPSDWEILIESDIPYNESIPTLSEGVHITDFQRLLIIKVLRQEKLIASVIEFIKDNLGTEFMDTPPLDLSKIYKDTSNTTPLIFILSTGSDPVSLLTKFAQSREEANYRDRLHLISLGQGQGPIAEELIRNAITTGDWVFLQNCHLAASWMPRLETIVKDFGNGDVEMHPDFRLFLSSMPSKIFPVSVLQESVKATNEPPTGLKANLARTFADITPDLFDEHPPQGVHFKKLLFGLCFFNAVVNERKKFGPLGWNIVYDWSQPDLEVSIAILKNSLIEQDPRIPWNALLYLTGEITFGGRVTDDWDRRTLRTILQKYYNANSLEDGYRYSPSGIYYAPPDGDLASFKAYIDSLPYTEDPSVFGMHENASITYQLQETRRLIKSVVDVQPRMVTSSGGKSNEELAMDLVTAILTSWPDMIDLDIPISGKDGKRLKSAGNDKESNPLIELLFKTDDNGRPINSLSTVLGQETVRFNRLIQIVRESLEALTKAIKGLVVMSSEIEKVFTSLLNNEVPALWANYAYLSMKPLASWVKDFLLRVQCMRDWMTRGQPKVFWLSGFFFPQGFLTATLQNHSRKYNIPIDTLSFRFEVVHETVDVEGVEETVDPAALTKDGVIVRGLFIEGARWDREKRVLQDSFPMEMFSSMPLVRFIPSVTAETPDNTTYLCPLYKTQARSGTLSTTGHSTNFVIAISLASDKPPDYWILKGVALLCQLND